MNRSKSLLLGVAASGLLVLAGFGDALAQDPAVVNAKTIRVKLENSRVRVFEAVLKPNDREQLRLVRIHLAPILMLTNGIAKQWISTKKLTR